MSFLSDARSTVEDQLIPDLESHLDQKVGAGDKFYVRRKLLREDVDEQDQIFLSLADPDASTTLREKDLLGHENYVVLGRSGAGKSALSIHTAVGACRRFLEEDNAPFPIFLELGTEVNQGNDQAIRNAL